MSPGIRRRQRLWRDKQPAGGRLGGGGAEKRELTVMNGNKRIVSPDCTLSRTDECAHAAVKAYREGMTTVEVRERR